MKGKLNAVIAHATQLIGEVKDNSAWGWADNEQNVGKLRTKIKDVREGLTEFTRLFLTRDTVKLNKSKTKQFLLVELGARGFGKLKQPTDDLKLHCDVMVKMHHALHG